MPFFTTTPRKEDFMKRYMDILHFCMLFMAFFLSGCSLSPTNTGVLIGTNLALSGKGCPYSSSTERGIELAEDMVDDRRRTVGPPDCIRR